MAELRYIPPVSEAFLKVYQITQKDLQKHAEIARKAVESIQPQLKLFSSTAAIVSSTFNSPFFKSMVQNAYEQLDTTNKALNTNVKSYEPSQPNQQRPSQQYEIKPVKTVSEVKSSIKTNLPTASEDSRDTLILQRLDEIKVAIDKLATSKEVDTKVMIPSPPYPQLIDIVPKQYKVLNRMAALFQKSTVVDNYYLAKCIHPLLKQEDYKTLKNQTAYNTDIYNRFRALRRYFTKVNVMIDFTRDVSKLQPLKR